MSLRDKGNLHRTLPSGAVACHIRVCILKLTHANQPTQKPKTHTDEANGRTFASLTTGNHVYMVHANYDDDATAPQQTLKDGYRGST